MKSLYFKQKSLIHRLAPLNRKLITLSYAVAPQLTLVRLEKVLSNPRSQRDYEFSRVPSSKSFEIKAREGLIHLNAFERPGPAVILSHGWADNAKRFEHLIEDLLEKNYSVYAFDHLGCGRSSGKKANLLAYIDGFESVLNFVEKRKEVHALISHSMGSLPILNLSTEKLQNKKMVLIAGPVKYYENLFETLEKGGVPQKVFIELLEKVAKSYGKDWRALSPQANQNKINNDFLFIHDTTDRFCSYTNMEDFISGSPAHLFTTEGLGHHRIMKNKEVLNTVLNFL